MKKCILSLFLVILMTVCFVPVSALAAEEDASAEAPDSKGASKADFTVSGYCGPIDDQESVSWELNLETGFLHIKGPYNFSMGVEGGPIGFAPWQINSNWRDTVKQAKIEYITEICDDAFNGCSNLVGAQYFYGHSPVTKKIGKRAFANCPKLEYNNGIHNLIGSRSIEEIGEEAFKNCPLLTNVTVADHVKTIGSGAFSYCENLKTVTFEEGGISSIPNNMFSGCPKLESITIPSTVGSIGSFLLMNCPNVTAINVAGGNPNYSSDNGALFNKNKTELLVCPAGKENYTIPEATTAIQAYAFYGCEKLQSITIPSNSNLQVIGQNAFERCSKLETIALPDSVTSIGQSAFCNCDALENIEIPLDVTEIKFQTFCSCDLLNSIEIPSGVTSIDTYAFSDNPKLSTVTFKGGAPAISAYAFINTRTEAHFPAADESWTDSVLQNYGGQITWVADDPIDLSGCEIEGVPAQAYTGQAIEPELTVTLNNKTLVKDRDYTISFENNTNVGTATLTISGKLRYTGSANSSFKINPAMVEVPSGKTLTYTGKEQIGVAAGKGYSVTGNKATKAGSYTATLTLTDKNNTTWSDGTVADKNVKWEINKAANPMNAKGKTAQVKYKKLKKSSQTLAVTKVIKFTKDAKDNKTYKLSSAKKGSKSFKKYFKVKKSTGKVTVKKGLKKGTYKVIVKIKAQGNTDYEASAWKKVTFKVTVK